METLGNNKNVQIFYCEKCDYTTCRRDNFQKHTSTHKHIVSGNSLGRSINEEYAVNNHVYICTSCDYNTSRKSNFVRHLLSAQHLLKCRSQVESRGRNAINSNDTTLEENSNKKCPMLQQSASEQNKCTTCNRVFQTRSGLWKHVPKCSIKETNTIASTTQLPTDVVKLILDSNAELAKTNNEMMEKIVEAVCKHMQTNNTMINNNNMINSNNNNKTFNLQVFLNETCKDALNLSEFIQSMKSSFDDIESIGSLGYVDGTSKFIIRHLNELGVEKRPIQCTDAKRQILYIKENNAWFKEDDNLAHIHAMVDEVQRINLKQLPAWREKHPRCLTSNSIYTDTYNTMSQELIGGFCHKVKLHVKDTRIINKIIKEVVIDKQLYLTHK